jgi:5-methylcytosine-specific restriction endonuclease McrA
VTQALARPAEGHQAGPQLNGGQQMSSAHWFRQSLLQLASDEGENRRLAIKNIGQRSNELDREAKLRVAERLTALLRDDPWEPVQMWAAWALGAVGERSTFPALVHALTDDNRDVRCHAALSLGKIGDPEAVPILANFLSRESDELTRRYALRALGYFAWRPKQEEARQILKRIADDDQIEPSVRAAAVDELVRGTSRTPNGTIVVQMQLLDAPQCDPATGGVATPEGPLGVSVRRQIITTSVPKRDQQAKEDYKRRVGSRCQVCLEPPFRATGGIDFCEVHHIIPLKNNGLDAPPNLLVVCPTCHKKLHFARSVRFRPDPWIQRPEIVTINDDTFRIDWRLEA